MCLLHFVFILCIFSRSENMPDVRANVGNISILQQQLQKVFSVILSLVMLALLSVITYLSEKHRVGPNLDFSVTADDPSSANVPYFLRWNHSEPNDQNVTYM